MRKGEKALRGECIMCNLPVGLRKVIGPHGLPVHMPFHHKAMVAGEWLRCPGIDEPARKTPISARLARGKP